MTLGSTSNGKPILNGQIFNHGTTGVRQTVQSGSVDANGYANFISIGTGLSVNLAATTVPLNIHSAGGSIPNDRLGVIPTDTTLALPASQTNFIMATIDSLGVVTLSSVILPIVYQFGGTPSVTNNQYTFNIGEMKMYRGNGSTASQVWAVCVGEAVTSGTAVTSVVSYALNGVYIGAWTNTLITAASTYSWNHYIGIAPLNKNMELECITTDGVWAVGNRKTVSTVISGGTAGYPFELKLTDKIVGFTSLGTITYPSTTNSGATLTVSNWKYRLIAQRGW